MAQREQIPLNEWQVEEKRLPTITLDQQGDPQVAERVVRQRYMHVPLIPQAICSTGEHYFVFLNGGRCQDGRVIIRCRSCSVGNLFTRLANAQSDFVIAVESRLVDLGEIEKPR